MCIRDRQSPALLLIGINSDQKIIQNIRILRAKQDYMQFMQLIREDKSGFLVLNNDFNIVLAETGKAHNARFLTQQMRLDFTAIKLYISGVWNRCV